MAETKIQQSMNNGDFQNLKGSGKELQHSYDAPFIDTTTQKLNRVLVNSGLLPAWVETGKEIKEEIKIWRDKLKDCVTTLQQQSNNSSKVEKLPTSFSELHSCAAFISPVSKRKEWTEQLTDLQEQYKLINKKIQNYNLIVPSMTQQRGLIMEEIEFKNVYSS